MTKPEMTNAIIESFLELYNKPRIRKQYRANLAKFFEWTKFSPEEIVDE